MYKTKATSEEKIKTVEAYLAGEGNQAEWAKKCGIGESSFCQWVRNYKSMRREGLRAETSNKIQQNRTDNYLRNYGLSIVKTRISPVFG